MWREAVYHVWQVQRGMRRALQACMSGCILLRQSQSFFLGSFPQPQCRAKQRRPTRAFHYRAEGGKATVPKGTKVSPEANGRATAAGPDVRGFESHPRGAPQILHAVPPTEND